MLDASRAVRVTVFLVAAVVLASSAGARAVGSGAPVDRLPRVAVATRLLRSAEGRDRAWGAYQAGRYRLVEIAPVVVEALRDEADRPLDGPGLALRALLLDALIRTEFAIPAPDLLPHARGRLVPAVLILLARRARSCLPILTRLFDRLEEGDTDAWLAAGNLLTTHAAPGFAARILRRVEPELVFQVFSRRGAYRGPGGRVTGCGRIVAPEGFPPLVLYKLGGPPPKDWPETLPPLLPRSLVADGPRPIHARRVESKVIWSCSSGPADRNACRAEWISDLLRRIGAARPAAGIRRGRGRWWRLRGARTETDLGPPARVTIDLRWAGRPPFLRQAGREHEALMATYWHAVRKLLAAGLLTRDEARRLAPRTHIRIRDLRSDRRTPIPPAPRPGLENPWHRRSAAICPDRVVL